MQQRCPETAGGGVVSPAREAQAPRDVCSCTVVCQSSSTAPLQRRAFATPGDALCFAQAVAESDDAQLLWVDAQGWVDEDKQRALRLLFPEMQPSHADAVLASDLCDVAELQAGHGEYVVGCLACSRDRGGPFLSSTPTEAAVDSDDVVLCSFACDERRLLTLHTSPFVGLSEALRRTEQKCNELSPLNGGLCARALRALVCFTCEASFTAPTQLLSEVGDVDEMALLISPGDQDQTDLLRRVALLRRRISNFCVGFYLKEKLLQDLIGPSMRLSFVSKNPANAHAYKEALKKVQQVSERLDDVRDMLNQANLNFIAGVSMRMSQASAGLDFKMTVLNQVAAVCLPINLVISIFGMNCKVPLSRDEVDTLVPFWCICGSFLLWIVLCFTPVFRRALRGQKVAPISPYS